MFKRERVDEGILEEMERNYYKNASQKVQGNQDHIKILEYLNSAAGLLEGEGLYKEAEEITNLIEVVAKKKKDEKKKDDKKKAKKKKAKEGDSPKSSEEAVKNLKTKGWMFSADDGKNAASFVVTEGDSDDDFIDDLRKLWE